MTDDSKLVDRPDEDSPEQSLQAGTATVFAVSSASLNAFEERRFPDDHEVEELRGQVAQVAQVHLIFDQGINFPTVVPSEGGLDRADVSILLNRYVARGIGPDMAIELGEYMASEGRRIKETVGDDPGALGEA